MIRWISDYLGTAGYNETTQEAGVRVVDVRDLVDKPGNLPDTTRQKIDEAVGYLKRGERVVVCCDYGISRSNAIAAGIISRYEATTFADAVRRVMAATGQKEIKVEVLSIVSEALGERTTVAAANGQKRILITGASGFIGRAIMGSFVESTQVFPLSSQDLDLKAGAADLNLIVKERGIDTLVHLAAPRIHHTNQALGDTLLMMKNVLDVSASSQLKLIYLSSWEVYAGYRHSPQLANEGLPLRPRGLVGETKFLCEQLLEQYRRNYDLKAVLVRSALIYGGQAERPKFIFNFLSKACENKRIVAHEYLNGHPNLDLLHVDDLVRALKRVMGSDFVGDLNVGSGRTISSTEVANLIIGIVGSKSEVTHHLINDQAPNIAMDFAQATAVLGWQPTITFEQGLRMLLTDKAPQLIGQGRAAE